MWKYLSFSLSQPQCSRHRRGRVIYFFCMVDVAPFVNFEVRMVGVRDSTRFYSGESINPCMNLSGIEIFSLCKSKHNRVRDCNTYKPIAISTTLSAHCFRVSRQIRSGLQEFLNPLLFLPPQNKKDPTSLTIHYDTERSWESTNVTSVCSYSRNATQRNVKLQGPASSSSVQFSSIQFLIHHGDDGLSRQCRPPEQEPEQE